MRPGRWLGARAAIVFCATRLIACGGGIPSVVDPPPTSTPLCDASDPEQVVAPQRIRLLTSTQLLNMFRLVSDVAAQEVVDGAFFDVTSDFRARFPPAATEQFRSIPDSTTLTYFDVAAHKVGEYVRDNFATVTGCASPATEACAMAYLDGLARKAYRRKLTAGEQERFSALYAELTSQIVNDRQVTLTIPEATDTLSRRSCCRRSCCGAGRSAARRRHRRPVCT